MNTWALLPDGRYEVNGRIPEATGKTLERLKRFLRVYGGIAFAAADRYGVPRGWAGGVFEAEAAQNFDDDVCDISFDHGVGLYQLTSSAARDHHSDAELCDPATNADAAMKFLAHLRAEFGSDLPRIAAAYNAGRPRPDASSPWNLRTHNPDYIDRIVAANNTTIALEGLAGEAGGRAPSSAETAVRALAAAAGLVLVVLTARELAA